MEANAGEIIYTRKDSFISLHFMLNPTQPSEYEICIFIASCLFWCCMSTSRFCEPLPSDKNVFMWVNRVLYFIGKSMVIQHLVLFPLVVMMIIHYDDSWTFGVSRKKGKNVFIFFQFLINGDSSPVHQGNADFELLHASLLSNPANIKSDAALTPVCNVKKERLPSSQSCSGSGNMKPIKPMPVTTSIPVSIQKSPVTKAAAGMYIPYSIKYSCIEFSLLDLEFLTFCLAHAISVIS